MMQQNLTVRLDSDVIHRAKVLAAKRSTSISRLVADEIDRLVREDEAYEQARTEALADLEAGFDFGGRGAMPDRGSIYDR